MTLVVQSKEGYIGLLYIIPLVRKLSQEPRVTAKANEVVARLGERLISRGLRAFFGLPEPTFDSGGSSAIVSEESM